MQNGAKERADVVAMKTSADPSGALELKWHCTEGTEPFYSILTSPWEGNMTWKEKALVSWYSGQLGEWVLQDWSEKDELDSILKCLPNHLLVPMKSICLVPVLGTAPLGFCWTSFPGGKFSRGKLIGWVTAPTVAAGFEAGQNPAHSGQYWQHGYCCPIVGCCSLTEAQ